MASFLRRVLKTRGFMASFGVLMQEPRRTVHGVRRLALPSCPRVGRSGAGSGGRRVQGDGGAGEIC